jgi:c-di-GMP-binding flagellar brake protein YcgR
VNDVDLPPVNSLVDVWCPAEEDLYRSRLESVDNGDLLVAAPLVGRRTLPTAGDGFDVQWAAARGALSLPVRFRSAESDRVPVWRLAPNGPARLVQRRQYARATANGTVLIRPARPDLTDTVLAAVVDVSEGGVRCRVVEHSIRTGEEVEVHLDLDNELFVLAGRVLRLTADPPGHEEAVIVFQAPERHADRIRRYVFNRQLHERRMANR